MNITIIASIIVAVLQTTLQDFQTSIPCRVPPQLGSEDLDATFGASEFQSDTVAEVQLYTFVTSLSATRTEHDKPLQ